MRFVVRDGRPALDVADPTLRLTEEQRAVFRHDRELVLVAGAGTGKTHTLALRFVALLVHLAWTEARPERVLVLTFTDRAAAEMAERCRARLAEAVAAADLGPWPGFAANLRRMLATFDAATIGTFHAFCGSIARRPGTAVLDPLLAAELRQEALAEALAELRDREPEGVYRLLDAFGTRDGILRAGAEVLGAPRAPLQSLAERIARAPVPPAEARAALAALRSSLELLVRLVSPSGGGPWVEGVRASLAEPIPADPLEVWGAWRAHLALLLTDRGTLRTLDHPTVLGPRAAWPDARRHGQAKQAAEVLAQRLAHVPRDAERARRCPTGADRVLHEILPVFEGLLADAEARLDAALDRRRALTFDALQGRAVAAVLGDEGLRRELRERFRYVMVDEFQDTDAAQWSLVRAIGRADPDVPEDRLFVVGDPKQAIYGFRGGDVTRFRAAVAEIGSPSHLSRNFRSRPELVAWFDRAFPAVFGTPRNPWEVGYDPLVAGREEPGGRVERIETEAPHWEVAADLVAEALAGGAGTVALLLRARTRQDRYEAALRARDLPYTVPAGVGFWSRPEVLDLVNALLAAHGPDPIATLAWLRGPLGALPDGAIDALGRDGLALLAEGGAPAGFEEVAGRFLGARRELGALPPSEWLERRIDELVPAFAIAEPSGRALRNARRLVERLRPLDVEGIEVVARVARRAIDLDEREGEAPAEETSGAILTTVHGAKGLEFDVVVVPELDRRAPPPRGSVLRARVDDRWELAFPVDDPDAAVQSRARPGLYEAVRAQLVAEQDAEERRLLYVAATRARERLVLLAEPDVPDPGALPTWHQLLRPATPELRPLPAAAASSRRAAPPAPDEPPPLALAAPREVDLSVSELLAFEACPAAWGHARTRASDPEPREAQLRAAVGRILHEILEDDDVDGVERRWRAAVPRSTPAETSAGVEAVRRGLAARSHPAVAPLLAAPGRAELAFRVRRGSVALRGRIDRLAELPDGPVVVDWKTGRRTPGVALQLSAYAWAASRALGRPVGARVVWTAEPAVEAVDPAPARIEALLDAVGGSEGPEALLALARSAPRPCATCPFAGAPCRGHDLGPAA